MNQAQKKLKLVKSKQDLKKVKTGAPLPEVQKPLSESDAVAAELTAFWREEIQNLQGKVFSSTAEAIDTLVDKVLDRLSIGGAERNETREYLVVLFDTDPELQEELSQLVTIK